MQTTSSCIERTTTPVHHTKNPGISKKRIPRVLTTPPATQTKAHAFLKAVVRGDEHMREKYVTQPWPQRRAVATHHESVKTTAHQLRTQCKQLPPRTHARVQWSSCDLESSRGLAFDDESTQLFTPSCQNACLWRLIWPLERSDVEVSTTLDSPGRHYSQIAQHGPID